MHKSTIINGPRSDMFFIFMYTFYQIINLYQFKRAKMTEWYKSKDRDKQVMNDILQRLSRELNQKFATPEERNAYNFIH